MMFFDTQLSRRAALHRIWQSLAALGVTGFISPADLQAAPSPDRPAVVWLHGSSCSGCSIALLDVEEVSVVDLLTRFTRMLFHPDLSLATGDQAVDILDQVAAGSGHLLVVEGGIPVDMPHACMMAHRPMTDWVSALARGASACVAAGTCAAAGGIPAMPSMQTGSHTLAAFLQRERIETPVVNLPNCPLKPEHLLYSLLHLAQLGRPPQLDAAGRPVKFFGRLVHEQCVRYADFQEEHFAREIGDPGCLLHLGCQGPVTYNDCLITGHNGNTNTCIRAGHPCVGCASEHFPRRILFHAADDHRANLPGGVL